MSDRHHKSCETCKFWKKLSRRQIGMIYGDCMYPEPELPASMTINNRHMANSDGIQCKKWEKKAN